jgi:hypothetical protein
MAEVTRDSLVDLATESHNTARFHVAVIASKPKLFDGVICRSVQRLSL